jgi:hypothetical protein
VVGDAEIAVAQHLGPPPEFRGDELTVAIQGMGMQINHKNLFSVFGKKDAMNQRIGYFIPFLGGGIQR